jgi:hypothetical protein
MAKTNATTDQHGRRLTSSAHDVCVVLAGLKRPATRHDIAMAAGKLSLARGVEWRGAVESQLSHMKRQKLTQTDGNGNWSLTPHGAQLWKSGVSRTRKDVDALAAGPAKPAKPRKARK